MKLLRLLNHPYVYLITCMLLAAGLPLSRWLMGLTVITLASKWVYDRLFSFTEKFDLLDKLKLFWSNKPAVVLAGVYVMHLLGLLWTSDFDYAANDLRIKLPLLVMPIVLVTMPQLSKKGFRLVIFSLVFSCFCGTMHAYGVKFGWIDTGEPLTDTRDMVQFISHVRFSLCTAMAIFILLYYTWQDKMIWKLIYFGLVVWFLIFLYVLASPTGFAMLLVGGVAILVYQAVVQRKWWLRLVVFIPLIALPFGTYLYIRDCIESYYDVEELDFGKLPQFTENGEQYYHDPENRQIENGHYVWINIAWGELAYQWEKRSEIKYDSTDAMGQPISGTLIRYLTSKGLRKDSAGVVALSAEDVQRIESGTASILVDERTGIRKRVEQIIFEFDAYFNGGNPSHNSITQRFEFWKAAGGIIQQNLWTGVGTGDVRQSFDQEYERIDTMLEEEVRHRAHNQYLTIFLTFGIFGFIYFLFSLFYPVFKQGLQFDYLYIVFFLTAVFSFLSEDTLETQAGVTFFAFLNSFLLFARGRNNEEVTSPEKS